MKLFNTVKKKVAWVIGAATTVVTAAYPLLPIEQKIAINEVIKPIIEEIINEKATDR